MSKSNTKYTPQHIFNQSFDDTTQTIVMQQVHQNGASLEFVSPDPLASYKISDKDDDASPNYFGFTKADGSWYILKETVSAGADTYRYAAGSSSYTTNWTNRASLSFDHFYNVF